MTAKKNSLPFIAIGIGRYISVGVGTDRVGVAAQACGRATAAGYLHLHFEALSKLLIID